MNGGLSGQGPHLAKVAREIKHRLISAVPVTTTVHETQFVNNVTFVARDNGISDSEIEAWEAARDPMMYLDSSLYPTVTRMYAKT